MTKGLAQDDKGGWLHTPEPNKTKVLALPRLRRSALHVFARCRLAVHTRCTQRSPRARSQAAACQRFPALPGRNPHSLRRDTDAARSPRACGECTGPVFAVATAHAVIERRRVLPRAATHAYCKVPGCPLPAGKYGPFHAGTPRKQAGTYGNTLLGTLAARHHAIGQRHFELVLGAFPHAVTVRHKDEPAFRIGGDGR